MGVPAAQKLTESNIDVAYVIIRDETVVNETLSTSSTFKKRRIYNYRLSRARHVEENAFDILTSSFCMFLSPFNPQLQIVEKVVLTSRALHNYLRSNLKDR